MIKVKHLSKNEQQIELLFNGAFTENKPIPFPNNKESEAYSNLFYWAHLVAHDTSEFPLHPHEGFEIMTFVLQGSVEHFDTASRVYTPLTSGDVQAIQAGSGVSHSERIIKGTEMFQIWFDPDFSKTMNEKARYKDYSQESFHRDVDGNQQRLTYVGQNGVVNCVTESVEIYKMSFKKGTFSDVLDPTFTYSYYLLSGTLVLGEDTLIADDFYVFSDASSITLNVFTEAELFVIKTPTNINYRRFIDRYQKV